MAAQQQPLTVLITRPQAQAEAFAAALEAATPGCWRAVIAPLMQIVPQAGSPDLEGVSALIFTSANGVAFAPVAPGLPAFCVGARTTAAARDAGFEARCMGGCADELVARLIEERPAAGRWLHLRGKHARGDVAGSLSKAGLETGEAVVYDQRVRGLPDEVLAALCAGGIDALPLFSPLTAMRLRSELDGRPIAPGCATICLSPAVAEALGPVPGPLAICAEPTGDEMLKLLAKMCRH